jgi:hypothetical protein
VDEIGPKQWKRVAEWVRTRDHVQCRQRWAKVQAPGLVKGSWTREEDERLVSALAAEFKSWSSTAAHVPGRTSKQCRERWAHHLDPRVRKGLYTEEEDERLLALHRLHGNRWSTIATELGGRSSDAVRARWVALSKSSSDDTAKPRTTQPKATLSATQLAQAAENVASRHHRNSGAPASYN